jgi:condensin complex subunit 1
MLHLIWSKDNNSSTSEDGKELKGVRSRLLECYRSLYFDALPDMEAKQQVNRIAKNMIEYVYPPLFIFFRFVGVVWCSSVTFIYLG